MSDAKTFPTDYDQQIIKLIEKIKSKIFVVINKIDLVKNNVLKIIENQIEKFGLPPAFFISVTNAAEIEKRFHSNKSESAGSYETDTIKNIGVAKLKKQIIKELPVHPPYYPVEDIAVQHIRFFVKEKIREKIFLNLKEELPYSSAVTIEIFDEFENKVDIWANIYVETKSQKKIVIGRNGSMIKQIRKAAEHDIYGFLQKRVKLHLWVKVRNKWRKKERILKEFGY